MMGSRDDVDLLFPKKITTFLRPYEVGYLSGTIKELFSIAQLHNISELKVYQFDMLNISEKISFLIAATFERNNTKHFKNQILS